MKLRLKLILVGLSTVTLLASAELAIQHFVVSPSFVLLEENEARKDLTRCNQAIDREIHHLDVLCLDWSNWTDTYDYVQDIDVDAYEEANLVQAEWYEATNVGMMYIVRSDGTLAHTYLSGDESDDDGNLLPPEPTSNHDDLPRNQLPLDHPLLAVTDDADSAVSGLLMTSRGPLLVASRPILTSDSEGPRTGVMIIGRFLDDDQIQRLADQTQVHFEVLDASDKSPEATALLAKAIPSNPADPTPPIEIIDDQTLHVWTARPQLNNQAGLVLKVKVNREITARGAAALSHARNAQALAAAVVMLFLAIALRRAIVSPISRLTDHAARVAQNNDLSVRLQSTRGDEIGTLSRAFDNMIDQLDHSRAQLADHARHAGRAEAASGVLHNVGNILTSVKVLTVSIHDQVKETRTDRLAQTAQLLHDHAHNLSHFLTADPRGQRLPGYLENLSGQMQKDQDSLQERVSSLGECVRHMQELVASQQTLAHSTTVDEPVNIDHLIEHITASTQPTFESADITFNASASTNLPTLVLDRSKLGQVLVNLLTNAHDAIVEVGPTSFTPHVQLNASHQGEHLIFEVIDTGAGIAPEFLERIFSSGFTTKTPKQGEDGKKGQGLGLHYCAISAVEMGGSLTAHSEGLGHGATFRLTLPWNEHLSSTTQSGVAA